MWRLSVILKINYVVLVFQSVDTLQCRYGPEIGQIYLISVLVLWGFPSYVYARYLCVVGPTISFPQWASGSLKSVFDRAQATLTRPLFNIPSECRCITFCLSDTHDPHLHWPRSRQSLLGFKLQTFAMVGGAHYLRDGEKKRERKGEKARENEKQICSVHRSARLEGCMCISMQI